MNIKNNSNKVLQKLQIYENTLEDKRRKEKLSPFFSFLNGNRNELVLAVIWYYYENSFFHQTELYAAIKKTLKENNIKRVNYFDYISLLPLPLAEYLKVDYYFLKP